MAVAEQCIGHVGCRQPPVTTRLFLTANSQCLRLAGRVELMLAVPGRLLHDRLLRGPVSSSIVLRIRLSLAAREAKLVFLFHEAGVAIPVASRPIPFRPRGGTLGLALDS